MDIPLVDAHGASNCKKTNVTTNERSEFRRARPLKSTTTMVFAVLSNLARKNGGRK